MILLQGDSFSNRQFIERVKTEILLFVSQCFPLYRLVVETELGSRHLPILRSGMDKWRSIIEDCRLSAPGKLRNHSRESGACYTLRCITDNSGILVFCFNPFVNVAISFIQDVNGFQLGTAQYHDFEKVLIRN